MMNSMYKLLKETCDEKATNSSAYTHVDLSTHNKYSLKASQTNTFWEEYCNLVSEGETPSIAERVVDSSPVVAHFNFKFDKGTGEVPEVIFIRYIVECFQQAIISCLEIGSKQDELVCVVLESKEIIEIDGNDIFEMRIQFPYCRVDNLTLSRILRPKIIQFLRIKNVISKLEVSPIGDWDSIIDASATSDALMMYGCCFPGRSNLIFTHLLERVDTLNEDTESLDLEGVFIYTNHSLVQQGLLDEPDQEGLHHWLPLFLSVGYWNKITIAKRNLSSGSQISVSSHSSGMSYSYTAEDDGPDREKEISDIDLAETLLFMLGTIRVSEQHYWMDVGRALYNSSKGANRGLDNWIAITKKSDMFSEEECQEYYYTFQNTNITVKTLAYFAREDSPDSYRNWHHTWCRIAFNKALSCLDEDLAEAFYRFYWLDLVATGKRHDSWYIFNGHRWEHSKQSMEVRQRIPKFRSQFENIRSNLCSQVSSGNEIEKRHLEEKIKQCGKCIETLKKDGPLDRCIRMACTKFYNSKFTTLLDSACDIIGLENCVIQTNNSRAIVRPGKPEDYISMSCGICYDPNINRNNVRMRNLKKWLKQIFVNPNLYRYFKRLAGSFVRRGNLDKIVQMWSGNGDNSKSMLVKLFQATLGQYCVDFPVEAIMGIRRNASGPSPELAQAKNTLLAFVKEPDEGDSFSASTLKALSGNDTFFGRFLNDNGGRIEATFKLIIMCNVPPDVKNADPAAKNRMRVLPFESKWVSNAPDTEQEQREQKRFRKDVSFADKIPGMATPFISLLVKWYAKYKENGLVEPTEVGISTNEYWDKNDFYSLFIKERIVKVENDNQDVKLSIAEAYSQFKTWFSGTYPGTKTITRPKFKEEMIRKLGIDDKGVWYGYQIKEDLTGLISE